MEAVTVSAITAMDALPNRLSLLAAAVDVVASVAPGLAGVDLGLAAGLPLWLGVEDEAKCLEPFGVSIGESLSLDNDGLSRVVRRTRWYDHGGTK